MATIMQAQEINQSLTEDELKELLIIAKKWRRGMIDILIAVGVRKPIYREFFKWYAEEFY